MRRMQGKCEFNDFQLCFEVAKGNFKGSIECDSQIQSSEIMCKLKHFSMIYDEDKKQMVITCKGEFESDEMQEIALHVIEKIVTKIIEINPNKAQPELIQERDSDLASSLPHKNQPPFSVSDIGNMETPRSEDSSELSFNHLTLPDISAELIRSKRSSVNRNTMIQVWPDDVSASEFKKTQTLKNERENSSASHLTSCLKGSIYCCLCSLVLGIIVPFKLFERCGKLQSKLRKLKSTARYNILVASIIAIYENQCIKIVNITPSFMMLCSLLSADIRRLGIVNNDGKMVKLYNSMKDQFWGECCSLFGRNSFSQSVSFRGVSAITPMPIMK